MDMAVLLTEAFTGCSTSCNTHMFAVMLMSLCSTHDLFACQACKAPGYSCCNINAKLVKAATPAQGQTARLHSGR